MDRSTRRTGRKPRYQVFLGVRVSPAMKAQTDALAEDWDVDLSEVVRQALKVGLSGLTEPEAPEQAGDAARRWWDDLDRRQRSRWGKRLDQLDGAAFLEEAYRQAMQEGDR